jgi:hypothetical protein
MSHFYGLHVDKANEGDLQDKIERVSSFQANLYLYCLASDF